MTNNAVLVFDRADSYTFPGSISGSGGLLVTGGGQLTTTGSVSAGSVTVAQGQIVAGPGNVNVTGNLTVLAAQQFTFSGSNLFVANLANSGTFVGGATITGNFQNSPSGDVWIESGQTLLLSNSNTNAGTIELLGSGGTAGQPRAVPIGGAVHEHGHNRRGERKPELQREHD